MFHLIESNGFRRSVVRSFATFEEAEAHCRATFKLVCFEVDADYPGCADMFAENGNVYAIEPARRVAA